MIAVLPAPTFAVARAMRPIAQRIVKSGAVFCQSSRCSLKQGKVASRSLRIVFPVRLEADQQLTYIDHQRMTAFFSNMVPDNKSWGNT